jgi:hypothetical protein
VSCVAVLCCMSCVLCEKRLDGYKKVKRDERMYICMCEKDVCMYVSMYVCGVLVA